MRLKKGLSEAELRGVAEVVSELAALRDQSFDARMTGIAFTRAALRDARFRAQLAETHWRLLARRVKGATGHRLEPFAPLVPELEEEAKRLLGRSDLLSTLAFLSAPQ